MKSLKNYTLKHLAYVLPLVVALWAGLFYAYILDEVYDNVDDGLKNQKINIIRQAYLDSTVLQTRTFGINQFRIYPTDSIEKANVYSREFIYMEYDAEMEPYRLLRTGFFGPNGQPYGLEIRTSTVEEDDLIIDLSVALLALYLLLLLTIFLVNNGVLTRALAPLQVLTQNLQQYRFGMQSTFQPSGSKVKEFQILSEKVEEMIKRNEHLFQKQKTFIENAAHELQTPLAISINQLELLLQDSSLNENQSKRIDESKRTLHRLVHLNRSLLMLSRIDNRQFPELETVSFHRIWQELTEEMEDLVKFKNLQVNTEVEADFEVEAHPELMKILVSNLFRNAVRYSNTGGHIQVSMARDHFEIKNTSDLAALHPDMIYDRFYKYPQDSQSTGLGLSIVQSIVHTYPHLKIQYRYAENRHCFTLYSQKFPNSLSNFTA